ncbi:MAG: cyclic nucleotide-binding domain-containing protein [Sulfurovum sp.]|nr:cyclic nucleotide-binding domain-containing protein [Sulfurovum sp.]
MSFSDQKEFLKSICPFSDLSDTGLDLAIENIEIGFYAKDSEIIIIGSEASVLYIVIKGEVKTYDEDGNIIRDYHETESFGANALTSNKSQTSCIVTEDLICYELSRKGFIKLLNNSKKFKQFYLMDVVERMNYLKKKETSSDLSSFMVDRVDASYIHEPCIVSSDTLVSVAIKKSVEMKSSSIVVKKGNEYGIVTDSGIKIALAEETLNLASTIDQMAQFPIISVDKEDFLFNVYLLLLQKNIKRVAVRENGEIIGMLEQMDILSYFANNSRLATVKIEKSKTIDELREASMDYISVVKKLHAQGVKARYIAKLISEINLKVFSKLFEMILPENLQKDCALLVMGSEGRGEQILRTDQDNGLIIRDGIETSQYYPYMQKFTEMLISFGYPRCDGNIMVSNPYWCKNEEGYKKEIIHWIEYPDMDSYMHFSIFFDAKCVAGDPELLESIKYIISKKIDTDNEVYMARFAKLTTLFETPVGFFSTLLNQDKKVDIKKAGVFPVVQGTRSLSLQYKIDTLSTVERIKELKSRKILPDSMADELIEVFEVLLYLRLERQIDCVRKGKPINNVIDTELLSRIQRDLFKDSLQIVEQFKKFIVRHFRLENL